MPLQLRHWPKKNSEAKLAKVDATVHKELSKQYGVKGFPTLVFFNNGVKQDYNGGRTADTIVAWIDKKVLGVPKLTDKDTANKLVEDNKVVVIGFFKDASSKEAEAFSTVANSNEEVVCASTSSEEIFTLFNIVDDSAVVILKKFDEGRNQLEGDITVESVTQFISANSLPLVVEFTAEAAKAIFQGSFKNHFLIFTSGEDEDLLSTARKMAADYKGDVMFVTVSSEKAETKRIFEFFGVTNEDVPLFLVSSLSETGIKKYRPEDVSLTEENMRSFLKSYKAGELKPHLKSQDLPEDWDANPVKVLVSKNFNSIAMEEGKAVFVEFYAPWCGHCKNLAPIWDELGDHFKNDDKIVIAKIDMIANELENVKITGFPTIKLFAEDNTVIDYSGGRALENFVEFLEGLGDTEDDEDDKKDPPKKEEL